MHPSQATPTILYKALGYNPMGTRSHPCDLPVQSSSKELPVTQLFASQHLRARAANPIIFISSAAHHLILLHLVAERCIMFVRLDTHTMDQSCPPHYSSHKIQSTYNNLYTAALASTLMVNFTSQRGT